MPAKRWSPTECAAALRISDRHLRRLVADQVLVQTAAGFDPLDTCLRFIQHLQKDEDTKSARRELMQVEAQRKRMLIRRHLGEMATREELTEFGTDIWVRVHGAWTAAAAHLFHALTGVVDQREQYRIAHLVDSAGKYEINRLRDDLEGKLKDMRRDLKDEGRVEKLLVELAGRHEASQPEVDGQAEDA